jgi:hypothetical protein
MMLLLLKVLAGMSGAVAWFFVGELTFRLWLRLSPPVWQEDGVTHQLQWETNGWIGENDTWYSLPAARAFSLVVWPVMWTIWILKNSISKSYTTLDKVSTKTFDAVLPMQFHVPRLPPGSKDELLLAAEYEVEQFLQGPQ